MPPTALWPLSCSRPALAGAGEESFVQRLVGQEKRHVHARACFRRDPVGIKAARVIQRPVDQAGLLVGQAVHGGHAALGLEPLEHQPGEVDRIGGRCVEHGIVLGHGSVIERRRADGQGAPQQIVAHKDQGEAGRADVFLGTGKGQAHALPGDGAGEDMRGAIHHQRRVAAQGGQVGQLVHFHTVDGLVGADMHIGGAGAQLPGGRPQGC